MNKRQAKKALNRAIKLGEYGVNNYRDYKRYYHDYYESEVQAFRTEDRWLCIEPIGNRRTKSKKKATLYRIYHTDLGWWESKRNNYYVGVYMSDGCKIMEYKCAEASGRHKYDFEVFDIIVSRYGLVKVS